MVRVIPVSGGKYEALVDDEDYHLLMQKKWRLSSGYPARNVRYIDEKGKRCRKTLRMHVQLNAAPLGFTTDHINGDKLDNRKENLRNVTKKQNQMNRKVSKHSTSGFKGVGWCKQTKKWRLSMTINGVYRTLGRFSCIKEAALKYNEYARKYHGEFARLNIIEGV